MKRLMDWQPDPENRLTHFVVEWDSEDVEAPHICKRAVVNGRIIRKDPQGAYEAALAVNRAQNAKRRRK